MGFKFTLNLSFTAALFSAISVQKNVGENKHDFEGLCEYVRFFVKFSILKRALSK